MAEVVIEGDKVLFPPICPVCTMPATKVYIYQKRFDVPGLSQRVRFPVGYCDRHVEQLVKSDRKLKAITTAVVLLLIMLWAIVAYLAIQLYPGLKIIPGDSPVAWASSIVLVMCVLGILPAIGGIGILIPFGMRVLPTLIRTVFESKAAKTTRGALSVKSFDMPIPISGRARVRKITFRIEDHAYAAKFAELNGHSGGNALPVESRTDLG